MSAPVTPLSDTERSALHRALVSSERPRRSGPVAASLAFAWRALLKIKHVPDQLSDAIIFPVMFTLLFTYLFGGAMSGSPAEYLQYFLPGVVVLAVALTSMYTGITLNQDMHKGTFDRFRSLPIWRPSVLVGSMLGDVVRYAVASTVPLLLGLLLGFRPEGGLVGVLLALLFIQFFTFSLAWIWTLFGVMMRTPTAVQGATFPLQFLLVFGSNILVDPDTMPSWLGFVVSANPVSHATTVVRGLMHGSLTPGELLGGFVACGVLILLFAPLTMFFYNRKQR
ncbi:MULTISPECIES: ABC transporter permease [Nocardiopsis]|uniref:Transport permease protein n=1 Tax=Nocardiopsis sinuspersici TaxID=501010 RepID=A0A1V3BYY7_9ACTN|nr:MULTISPECIES: ABC transporter permease [Nocardiopsis]OOC53350.1 ABC transporter [Nocardiopsis sinuspersici]